MPTTFNLPKEYIPFVEQYHTDASQLVDSNSNLWIMKPISLSRGRGICVINDVSSVLHSEPMVVQRYIRNPYLIDGFKWDLRLYVLVTSFNPLEAFIYEEGFARFATHPYSKASDDMTNNFIHLTNSSIQGKHNDGAAPPPDVIKNGSVYASQSCVDGGTKCSLQHLSMLLRERGVDFSALWDHIVIVILRALFAVQDSIPHQANSFELLGFDIIIDEHQKPWLLEANSSPSLAISTPLDKIVKESLIRDTLALVDPLAFDREALHLALQNRLNGEFYFVLLPPFPLPH
jgi:tubulin polyglutamylase TTLL5